MIILNGRPHEVKESSSVADLLAALGWKPSQVVVEHNGRVVPRTQSGEVRLQKGDQVEIILPVAGG